MNDKDKLATQAIEIAKREVLKKLAEEEPFLFDEGGIYHRMKDFQAREQNGEIVFTCRVYEGFVTDLVVTKVERSTFKKKKTP